MKKIKILSLTTTIMETLFSFAYSLVLFFIFAMSFFLGLGFVFFNWLDEVFQHLRGDVKDVLMTELELSAFLLFAIVILCFIFFVFRVISLILEYFFSISLIRSVSYKRAKRDIILKTIFLVIQMPIIIPIAFSAFMAEFALLFSSSTTSNVLVIILSLLLLVCIFIYLPLFVLYFLETRKLKNATSVENKK